MKLDELKTKINLELKNLLLIKNQEEYKSKLNELPSFAIINNEEADTNVLLPLLEAGADVDYINKLGNSLLHETIYLTYRNTDVHNTNIDMVKLLLAYGANPNALNFYDVSVLGTALRIKNINVDLSDEDHHKLIELLLKNGANSNHKDKFDNSCLDKVNMYCKNSSNIVEKLFLQHGLTIKKEMIDNLSNIAEFIKSALLAQALVEKDGIKQLAGDLKQHLQQLIESKNAVQDQGSVEQQNFIDHYLILI